jgi:hypothetical protein
MTTELSTLACPKQNPSDIEPFFHTNHNLACWETLPGELLEKILDLVGDPTLTVRVNKHFQSQSSHVYKVLLKQYAAQPSLTDLIPLPPLKRALQPLEKVRMIYLTVTKEVKNCQIDLAALEPKLPPLAPSRLMAIRKLIQDRLRDKASFYRAIFDELAQNVGQSLARKKTHEVIKIAENSIDRFSEIFEVAYMLDLKNLHLTHLPPQIGYLKDLVNLNLNNNRLTFLPIEMKALTSLMTLQMRGNPLSKESVKDICSSLPRLKNVVIDSEQPNLVEMFRTSFPHLNVTVTQVLRIEELI